MDADGSAFMKAKFVGYNSVFHNRNQTSIYDISELRFILGRPVTDDSHKNGLFTYKVI